MDADLTDYQINEAISKTGTYLTLRDIRKQPHLYPHVTRVAHGIAHVDTDADCEDEIIADEAEKVARALCPNEWNYKLPPGSGRFGEDATAFYHEIWIIRDYSYKWAKAALDVVGDDLDSPDTLSKVIEVISIKNPERREPVAEAIIDAIRVVRGEGK